MTPKKTTLDIEKPEGHLYIVADSHLDLDQAPYVQFVEMLDALRQHARRLDGLAALGVQPEVAVKWLRPRSRTADMQAVAAAVLQVMLMAVLVVLDFLEL